MKRSEMLAVSLRLEIHSFNSLTQGAQEKAPRVFAVQVFFRARRNRFKKKPCSPF